VIIERFMFTNLKLIREQTHLQISNMPRSLSPSLPHSQTLITCIISAFSFITASLYCWTHCGPACCGSDVLYE